MEIERKWLLDINNIPFDLSSLDHLDIEQAYISFKPTIRIRKIANKNEFILTIKSSSKDNGLSRQEYEINISEDEYNNLLAKKIGLTLLKTRYRALVDRHVYEIDLFHNEYQGLAYMEVEFKSVEEAKEFKAPDFVLKELTYEHRFSNSALANGTFNLKDLLNS